MAEQLGKFLTELPEATSLKSDDLMYVVASNTSKKIGVNNLKKSVSPIVEGTVNGNIASFTDGSDNPLEKCIAEIVPKQAGSGTPSPSNVRAISGYTAVNVNVSGKNKLPTTVSIIKSLNTDGTWTGNRYAVLGLTYEVLTDDGVTINGIKISGTATTQALFYLYNSNNASCTFNGNILSGCPNGGSATTYDLRVSDVTSGSSMEYGTEVTIALSDTGKWRCQIMVRNGVTMNGEVFYPMIRTATESAEYEPYKGSTTTTPLGQTVYGGQLNVLTGELTIDRASVDMGSLEWNYNSTYQRFGAVISDMKPADANGTPLEGLIGSAYATGSANNTSNPSYNGYIGASTTSTLYARNENYTDATAFTNGMTGQTVVYPLATPQTVQLTPQEVRSILGQNNISADTGGIDVIYARDLNIVINDLLERVTALENE